MHEYLMTIAAGDKAKAEEYQKLLDALVLSPTWVIVLDLARELRQRVMEDAFTDYGGADTQLANFLAARGRAEGIALVTSAVASAAVGAGMRNQIRQRSTDGLVTTLFGNRRAAGDEEI